METSSLLAFVVKPRTISASCTLKVSESRKAAEPPIVIEPVTFKLLLTCKSFPTVTLPPIAGFVAKLSVGVDPSPVPPVTSISFRDHEIDLT